MGDAVAGEADEVESDGTVLCLRRDSSVARLLCAASADPEAEVAASAGDDRAKDLLRRLRVRSRSAILHVEVSVLTRP